MKGCHSKNDTAGTLRKRYWPGLYTIDGFFICTSTTLDGCCTTLEMCVLKLLRTSRHTRSNR